MILPKREGRDLQLAPLKLESFLPASPLNDFPILGRLTDARMTADDPRAHYYQYRVRLVRLVKERDAVLRALQIRRADPLQDGAFRATEDDVLLRQIQQLTIEIAATTKLVNQYADEIGSPRAPE